MESDSDVAEKRAFWHGCNTMYDLIGKWRIDGSHEPGPVVCGALSELIEYLLRLENGESLMLEIFGKALIDVGERRYTTRSDSYLKALIDVGGRRDTTRTDSYRWWTPLF